MICDEGITKDGGALFGQINLDDRCAPEVTFYHAAGCHKREEIEIIVPGTNKTETVIVKEKETRILSDFIYGQKIVFGIILILIGPPVAFFGSRWFKYVSSLFGGFSACVIAAFTFQDMGILNTDNGLWMGLLGSVIIGFIAGAIIAKWIILGSISIGLTFGSFVGLVMWAFVSFWIMEFWEPFKSYIPSLITTLFFAAIFVYLAIKEPKKTIMYGTSLIGSYTFMRGWSLILGGYAGERIMYRLLGAWEEFELEWQMSLYVVIFYLTFTISAFYQFGADEAHELLVNEIKDQGNDLKDIQGDIGGFGSEKSGSEVGRDNRTYARDNSQREAN